MFTKYKERKKKMPKTFYREKLRMLGDITKVAAIAFILVLTTAATLMAGSVANAQSTAAPTTIPTHAFVTASPSPIGVSQTVYIDMWLLEINPISVSTVTGQNIGTGTGTATSGVWTGYTITVTAPSGKKTILGPYTSSDISTVDIQYVPTEVGTYTVKFDFPGQTVNGTMTYPVVAPHRVYASYTASSATTTFIVQQAPLEALPETPLPTDYWQTPIDWQNQLWYSISGNWFGSPIQWNYTAYQSPTTNNPDMIAPQTGHVVWTKSVSGPLAFGGQIGGSMYSANDLSNYYTGKTYEYFFSTPIIINGVLFYNAPRGIQPDYGFSAVNLRTGQTLYYSNATNEQPTTISVSGGTPNATIPGQAFPGVNMGEVFSHHNPNEVGGLAYLWGVSGNTVSMYDATTGNWILNILGLPTSASSNTWVTAPDGELLCYSLMDPSQGATTGWLCMFNTTLCLGAAGFANNGWIFRPQTGLTLNYTNGIQWNATVPIFNAPNQYTGLNSTETINTVDAGVVLATTGNTAIPQDYQMEVAYSATTGAFMWNQNRSVAQEDGQTAWGLMLCASNGIYVEYNKATMQFYGFSITTGQQLWGPTAPLPIADSSYGYQSTVSGNDFIFNGMVGLYAFNIETGTPAWSWTSPPAGLQVAWPTYPLEGQTPELISAGGMVFVAGVNSHGDQLYRGGQLYAVNATNGNLVWSVDSFIIGMAAADGYVVGMNGYENQLYCYGKGLSATTVSTPDTVIPQGTQVLIQGTVTDQSPGQTCLGIPAKGTPAISDASMSDWMAYLYMQQPKPTNATGVKVTLSAFDPNNNTYVVGTTTSDANGLYKIMWTPPVPGAYTIIATFAGSDSYFGSSAETAIGVSNAPAAQVPIITPAPAATSPQTVTPLPTAAPSPQVPATPAPAPSSPGLPTTYIVIAVVAIIVVVAVAALALRRRK